MKRRCYLLLAWLPLTALAATYPVDLDQQLNGAEIMASAETIDRDMAGLQLHNHGQTVARCSVVFRNGPEAPRTRRTEIQPGEQKILTAKFKREILRLRIQLTCEPR